MSKKPSPETQLRTLKREFKALLKITHELRAEVTDRRRIGAQMANICSNLGQEASTEGQKLGAHVQCLMRDMRENWDHIRRVP